jgi:hypothetical protein
VREKSSREWRATIRCQSDPAGAGRVWLSFRVDCFAGGHAEVVVPGSERRGSSVEELQSACRESLADIQSRETDEGTVLAASVAGASESAVIYRARNSVVFAAAAVPGDSQRAVLSAPSPIRAALLAMDRGELRNVVRSPIADAIDPQALAAHRATLIRYSQRCLVPARLVTLMVKASPDEIAAQLFDAAYVTSDCRPLQNGLESAPRDVVGPLVERWFRDHRNDSAPWPVALVRYANAHGISLPTPRADADAAAAVPDASRP